MPNVKEGEVTVVQIETEGYNKAKVTIPICAMKEGTKLQKYLDLLVPHPPATFKIIEGSGTIYLVGSHCVDYYGFKDEDETEDEEDETEEEMETEKTPSKLEAKKTPSKEGSGKKQTPVKDGAEKKTPVKEGFDNKKT